MPPPRRPAYKSLLLVAGALLVLLGTGNWILGAARAQPYLQYLHEHPGPRYSEGALKTQLLDPPDEEREERDVTRAKLEFYQLVQSGGRFMVILGAFCVLTALVNLTGTVGSGLSQHHPGV